MDYNDKDNKQDAMLELKEIYNSNSALFQYYKAINKQIEGGIFLTVYNSEALKSIISQIRKALPALSALHQTIEAIEIDNYNDEYKEKITNKVEYIKESMFIYEVEAAISQLNKFLTEYEEILLAEKRKAEEIEENRKKEQERKEREERERIAKEEAEKKNKEVRERKEREEKINNLKASIDKITKQAAIYGWNGTWEKRVREKQKELDALIGKSNNSNNTSGNSNSNNKTSNIIITKPQETSPKSTSNGGDDFTWLWAILSIAAIILIVIFWKFILWFLGISLAIVIIFVIIANIVDN